MQTNRPRADRDAGHAADPTPPGSVLLVAGEYAQLLRRVLEAGGAGGFAVTVADGLNAGVERLREEAFDAVLLGVDRPDAPRLEGVSRVREVAPHVAVILVGGGRGAGRAVEPDVDGWVAGNESANAIVACIRGVVERRRLREELRRRTRELEESEARFGSIIQRTADGIVIVDGDRRVRFANPAAELLFGRSAADLEGQEFGFAVVAGETTEIDIVRPAAREPIVAELRVSTTTWDGAAAQLVSLRDITDRKRAEERAQRLVFEKAAREQAEEASRRFRFLAEAGAALDASLDPEKTLVSLAELIVPHMADWCMIDLLERDRVERVAGAHADPRKNELLQELSNRLSCYAESAPLSSRVLQSGAAELHRALDAGAVRGLAVDDAHARLLLELGIRSCMVVPLQVRERRLGAMTFACGERDFDETDLVLAGEIARRAARALENARLYEAALAANRAKSDFLAVMSHELRTPLNAILGYTDLLLAGIAGEQDETQSGYLSRIHFSATRLLRTIEEILIYAEMEAGRAEVRPRTIRVGELIDEVAAIAEPLVREEGLDFRLEVRQPETSLFTDADRIRQILLNLLTNAVKFTERGTVGLSLELRDGQLVIAVSDTGIGIAPEELEMIFEPFRQVEQGKTRRAGGTGLGLSVSRQVARLLGGDLGVESTPGQGSTFTLRVPSRIEAR